MKIMQKICHDFIKKIYDKLYKLYLLRRDFGHLKVLFWAYFIIISPSDDVGSKHL
jgi:hypothetical protein